MVLLYQGENKTGKKQQDINIYYKNVKKYA